MPLISIAGGALFAERFGSSKPKILALHGWGRRGADFSAALEGLDALALDLPGFGASPPPDRAIGAAGYADLIAPVFDHFDQPPVIIGHSFGGRVAVARQAAYPDSASGLVLVGAPLVAAQRKRPRVPFAYRLLKTANQMGLVSDHRIEREKRRRGSEDYRTARGLMRDVLVTVVNESYESELASLKVPVYLLWGQDDLEVPVDVARQALRIIIDNGGQAELEVLADIGHHVPLHEPTSLHRAVLQLSHEVGI